MDEVTKEVLNELINFSNPNSVSLYMPIHPGTDVRQDPIRLKNLLQKAKQQLNEQGLEEKHIQQILQPAHELLEDIDFWQESGSGMIIFLAPEYSKLFKIPFEVDELVVVTDRFHLKRFIPYFSEDQRFYILAVSQSKVRLLECTSNACAPMNMDGIAESMEDALGKDDTKKTMQLSGSRGGSGSNGAMFHGQGSAKDEELDKVTRYLKVIAKDLHAKLKDDKTPLVFAGVSNYYPIFQEVNTYPNLIDGSVEGSPERLQDGDLHAEAWKIVEPYFQQSKNDAIKRFKTIEGTMNVSEQIKTVASGAFQGRIDTLIVPMGVRQWGQFNESTGDIEVHSEQWPGDEDLFDFAAVHTLKNHGKVYTVKVDEMPNGGNVAAIFRF